jgi:DNA invertase Pin-like site-specific DNA recombinase
MRRCAIYTRKSSEEGLEQGFNSLDAQREACAAYVLSQTHEGWSVIGESYDDGGFSGGTLDRPGLKRLLADIEGGGIDIVVVYKVDRLTRSLADFAKIVEAFEKAGVSFVSVTQAFSTTTSMGRLTLNMLLSFAQFEREVTAERIRDKIAASKRKGLWMGGLEPFGYRAEGRTLRIDDAEAAIVRELFRTYLELGCVTKLKEEAQRRGYRTRERPHFRANAKGGLPFNRGHLYQLLNNQLYIGRIVHKGTSHPGQHPAIIDQETWNAVQAKLAENTQGKTRRATAKAPSLLAGLIEDGNGSRLIASHATKQGMRYRYYVTPPNVTPRLSLPAHEIEQMVRAALQRELQDAPALLDRFGRADAAPDEVREITRAAERIVQRLAESSATEQAELMAAMIERVSVSDGTLRVNVSAPGVARLMGLEKASRDLPWEITLGVTLKRRGQALKVIVAGVDPRPKGEPDPALVKAIVRAHDWFARLRTGATPDAIAAAEGLTGSYVTRVVRLVFLAPDIASAILDGREPVTLSADVLVQRSAELPLAWAEQRIAIQRV